MHLISEYGSVNSPYHSKDQTGGSWHQEEPVDASFSDRFFSEHPQLISSQADNIAVTPFFQPVILSPDEFDYMSSDISTSLSVISSSIRPRFNPTNRADPDRRLLDHHDARNLLNGSDTRTTFMIRRLNRTLTVNSLCQMINRVASLRNSFDLIYVPVARKSSDGFTRGFAFINFKDPKVAGIFLNQIITQISTNMSILRALHHSEIVFAQVQGKGETLRHISSRGDDLSFPPPGLYYE
jgi:hypothetical protein